MSNNLFGQPQKSKEGKKMNKSRTERITFWLFLFPSLFAFIMVLVIPFLLGVYYSFTDWNGIKKTVNFVGFDNYVEAFKQDPRFIYSILLTIIYALMMIIAVNVVSFGLALLVTKGLKFQPLYRVGFFIPNLIGGLILGYIWQFIYNSAVPAMQITDVIILGDRNLSVIAMVATGTWQYAGYIMLIYVTALQNVPKELTEAAEIDGATAWQRLRHITIPMVIPAFTVTLFLTLVNSFKQFDVNVSLTNGGPAVSFMDQAMNGTELLALNIYNEAFISLHMALGQAKAIIFFLALLIVSLIQVYLNKKKEVEM